MYNDYQYRNQIEKALGREIRDELWALLGSRNMVKRLATGDMTAYAIAEEIRIMERAILPPETESKAKDVGAKAVDPVRQEALASIIAREANDLSDVKAFRETFLSGLLSAERVDQWVRKRAEDEGESTLWLEFPAPKGTTFETRNTGLIPSKPITLGPSLPATCSRLRLLEWAKPCNGRWVVYRIPVRYGGCLDRLRSLSERLASRFQWQTVNATLFLLTGIPPTIGLIEVTEDVRANPQLTRLIMKIDPAVAPREIARIYSACRQRLFMGKRYRPMKEKHYRLATFWSSRKSEPIRKVMELWNTQNKKWRYKETFTFKRDAEVALGRLSLNTTSVAQEFPQRRAKSKRQSSNSLR